MNGQISESMLAPDTSVSFFDLGAGMCRWPLWDYRENTDRCGLYCGARLHEGAFCAEHAAMAYVPLEMRKGRRLPRAVLPGAVSAWAGETTSDNQAARIRPVLSVSPETREPAPAMAASKGRQQRDTLGVTAGETAPFHDTASMQAHYAGVRERLGGRRRKAVVPPLPAPPPAPVAELKPAPSPATPSVPGPAEIAAAFEGIVVHDGNRQALDLLGRLLRDELPGRSLYLYGPPGCGKSLMLAAARATLPARLHALDDAHDATEGLCRRVLNGAHAGLAVGRYPPSECRAAAPLARAVVVEIGLPAAAARRVVLEREAGRLFSRPEAEALDGLAALDDLPAALGALRTLVLTGRPVTGDAVTAHVARLLPTAERRVRVEDVQRTVCRHYRITREDLLSQRRAAHVVKPRQIAMYLAKTLTLRSLPEIGRRFGGRDHTTVLHAVRKIDGLVARDADVAAEARALTEMIREGAA